MNSSGKASNYKVVAENRRARFNYAIEEELDCGIMLKGTEVKALRTAQVNIAESYASVEDSELWLINSYIAPYAKTGAFRHDERRRRKLLVTRRQLAHLWSETQRRGMTLVPIVLFFNQAGVAKLRIGVARGRRLADKREVQRKRDWNRQKARLLRHR